MWSARLIEESPQTIIDLHRDYLEAGADIIITASYQASIQGWSERGRTAEEAEGLIAKSVELAKEAIALAQLSQDRLQPLVAASVGPYGAYLADGSEYRGNYDVDEAALETFHRKRLEILIDAEPDLIAFETIPSFDEIRVLDRLIAEHPEMPAWLTVSCPDAQGISDGTTIEAAFGGLTSPNIVAVGFNCTAPDLISPLLERAAVVSDRPLVVYPNSGEAWDAAEQTWRNQPTRSDFGTLGPKWRDRGAQVIGGCCRTRPDDIRRLRAELHRPRSAG